MRRRPLDAPSPSDFQCLYSPYPKPPKLPKPGPHTLNYWQRIRPFNADSRFEGLCSLQTGSRKLRNPTHTHQPLNRKPLTASALPCRNSRPFWGYSRWMGSPRRRPSRREARSRWRLLSYTRPSILSLSLAFFLSRLLSHTLALTLSLAFSRSRSFSHTLTLSHFFTLFLSLVRERFFAPRSAASDSGEIRVQGVWDYGVTR